MQLEYFDYLCKIDQCRSISAAARELFIEPPTLRAILKRMEKELGFPIFLRNRDHLELTAEGGEAMRLIREISASFDEIRHLGGQPQEDGRKVQLLCSPSISCGLSTPLSLAMRPPDGAPGSDLLIAETTGSQVGAKILQNEFNIALTYFQPAPFAEYQLIANKYQIQVHKVFHDHLYLLMRRDSPLSARAEIDRGTLRDLDFALLSHFTLSEDAIASTKPIQGRNRITVFSNVPLIKQAVLEQNMVSILSGYAICWDESADNTLLHAIPLAGAGELNEMDLCLIHRDMHSLRPAEQQVVSFIRDYFARLAPPPFSPEARGNPLQGQPPK